MGIFEKSRAQERKIAAIHKMFEDADEDDISETSAVLEPEALSLKDQGTYTKEANQSNGARRSVKPMKNPGRATRSIERGSS